MKSEKPDPIEEINRQWREYHKEQATMINEAAKRARANLDAKRTKEKEEAQIRREIEKLDAYKG